MSDYRLACNPAYDSPPTPPTSPDSDNPPSSPPRRFLKRKRPRSKDNKKMPKKKRDKEEEKEFESFMAEFKPYCLTSPRGEGVSPSAIRSSPRKGASVPVGNSGQATSDVGKVIHATPAESVASSVTPVPRLAREPRQAGGSFPSDDDDLPPPDEDEVFHCGTFYGTY